MQSQVNELNFDQVIAKVHSFIDKHKDDLITTDTGLHSTDERECSGNNSKLSPKPQPSIVLEQDTAVELGHPSTVSTNLVLWTDNPKNISPGKVHLLGKDLPQAADQPQKKNRPQVVDFAQIVMLCLEEGFQIDPFELEATQYLSNRIPGYMVRMVPNRLWARISHEAVQSGLNFHHLGKALINAYLQKFEAVKAVEVLFVTSGKKDIETLRVLAAQSKVISSKNKKLTLVGDAEYECADFNCSSCEEQPVCDEIRDIITIRNTGNARG